MNTESKDGHGDDELDTCGGCEGDPWECVGRDHWGS